EIIETEQQTELQCLLQVRRAEIAQRQITEAAARHLTQTVLDLAIQVQLPLLLQRRDKRIQRGEPAQRRTAILCSRQRFTAMALQHQQTAGLRRTLRRYLLPCAQESGQQQLLRLHLQPLARGSEHGQRTLV